MIAVFAVLHYLLWWAALLPLAAVALATSRGREVPPTVRILAIAFAISFFADLLNRSLTAHGLPNVWVTYLYVPVQFGLVLAVVAPRRGRAVIWLFFGLLVAASTLRGPRTMPEALVQIVAGAWIGLVLYRQPTLERYRPALLLYFVGAIPFLLVRSTLRPAMSPAWLGAWTGYQAVRCAALVLFAWAVSGPRRLGVLDGGLMGLSRLHVAHHDPDRAHGVPRGGRPAAAAAQRIAS